MRARMIDGSLHLYREEEGWELSGVGALIWRLSDGRHTVDDIANEIAGAYEVDRDQARADAVEFLRDLADGGFIAWTPDA